MFGENSAYLPEEQYCWGDFEEIQIAVCIPAFKETTLIPVLNSLRDCDYCKGVGIIIGFNCSENADVEVKKINRQAFDEVQRFVQESEYPYPIIIQLFENIALKKAGVGMGRKLIMDYSANLFNHTGVNGLLLCLDADCRVSKNYLNACGDYFQCNPNKQAASLYFEHIWPQDETLKLGIYLYELHLRYLKNGLKWAGFPWYFHTVGSSMAVRAETYLKSGGMNSRQAGEDYYFLHKLMPLGFGELTEPTVYPEARVSDRVPFGTGRSLLQYMETGISLTYSLQVFIELSKLFDHIRTAEGFDQPNWKEKLHKDCVAFWQEQGIESAWKESRENAKTEAMALSRFNKWFSGFRIIRYLNTMSEVFPETSVIIAATELLQHCHIEMGAKDLLEVYRQLDRVPNG